MTDKQKMIKTRDEYIDLVKKELMGPGSEISIPDEEHELISDAPNTRYSVGVLFTQNTKMNADNNDASRVEELDSDVQPEEETLMKKTLMRRLDWPHKICHLPWELLSLLKETVIGLIAA